MQKKVIIIGIGFASRLGLIRAVAQTGAEISVIAIGKKKRTIDRRSKYIRSFFPCKSNDEKMLMQILTGKCIDKSQKPVLIPANDFAASVLDRNLDFLETHFLIPHIHHRQGAITEWMNKGKQKALATEVGLNTTESKTVQIKDGAFCIPEGITYPCFTKTMAFMPGYKHTLHKCKDRAELNTFLNQLSAKFTDITVMVEAFKEIETEYAVVGFSDGVHVTIPGVIEILTMGKGADLGVTMQGEIKPRSGYNDILLKFEQLISRIGFVGLFDIDFYKSGGLYYFCEINFRIGGSGTAVSKCGVNLPAMFVYHMLGKSYETLKKDISVKKIFLNDRICMDCWYNGYITMREYKNLIQESDFTFLEDKEDSAPSRLFQRRIVQQRIKMTVKKVFSAIKRC